MSGVKFITLPTRARPALADVVAGHVDFTIATMPADPAGPRGRLRALGISAARARRIARRPDHHGHGPARYEYIALVRRLRARNDAAPISWPAFIRCCGNRWTRRTRATSCAVKASSRSFSGDQFRDKVRSGDRALGRRDRESGIKGSL